MIFSNIVLFLVFIFLLINNGEISESILESIFFCSKTIIPALFVYVVFAESLIRSNFFEELSRRSKKFQLITLFIVSSLLGAPIGARLSYCSYKNGSLTKNEALLLNSVTNNISLSFVVGACSFWTNHSFVAYIIQTISAFASPIFLVFVLKKDVSSRPITPQRKSFDIGEIIKTSASVMMNICASIIVFNAVFDLFCVYVQDLKNIRGIFEFSSGIVNMNAPDLEKMILFLSFSGFSVHAQIKSVWKEEIKYVKQILLPKIIQAITSVILTKIFLIVVDNGPKLL